MKMMVMMRINVAVSHCEVQQHEAMGEENECACCSNAHHHRLSLDVV